jgi:hypothetical protein
MTANTVDDDTAIGGLRFQVLAFQGLMKRSQLTRLVLSSC